jgi:MFS family permease
MVTGIALAGGMPRHSKMAMLSQFFGLMLAAYNMALLIVMAPILAKLFAPPKGDPAWEYVSIIFLGSITMVARPVGAAFFGHFADKIGRRFMLIITVGGVGVMSFASAFLPTQATAGGLAYLMFSVLCFFMGCFFGGEYAVGSTFAIEHAPHQGRGTIGGFVGSGFPLGYVLASLFVAVVSKTLGDKAMLDYGWRIVLASGIMPLVPALYVRKMLPESPKYLELKEKGTIDTAPIIGLFKPPSLWVFLQVFFFMSGIFLTDYAVYAFLPKILTGKERFDTSTYALIYGFALFVSFIGYNLYGWLSDVFGRKKLTMWYCVLVATSGVPVFSMLHEAAIARNFALAVLGASLAALLKLARGIAPSYLSERFPTRRRSVGFGAGYSAGALAGGAGISAYVWWAHLLPFINNIEGKDLWLSPAFVLIVGATMTFASLLFSPETRDIDLSEE